MQSVDAVHPLRHSPSEPHTSGAGQLDALDASGAASPPAHVSSPGSVQTSYLPDATQRSGMGQSRVSAQASWHRANTHTSGALQSLLTEHPSASPTGDALELLQLAAATPSAPAAAMPTQ
jgi:hypothetical protein